MKPLHKKKIKFLSGFLVLVLLSLSHPNYSSSQSLSELRDKISTGKSEIQKLEAEIQKFQKEINTVSKQANTLANEIKVIDLTRKKLASDISLTEKNISSTNLNIDRLGLEINNASNGIDEHKDFLSETLRNINNKDNENIVELFLSKENFSEAVDDVFRLQQIQKELDSSLIELKETKVSLEDKKSEQEKEKVNLENLKTKLADQKIISDRQKSQKDELLRQTKNEEASYRALLAERQARKQKFEQELRAVEDQIRVIIDPSSIPSSGSGVLKWPLDTIRITQQFGKTSDSKRLYASGTHNGVDFGVPQGTEVKAALSGTVIGAGDTDGTCRGASYGKWVLIKHDNGLATLYAHLSLIKVSEGQRVGVRQVIGYSGNTGYSTGPHLHFSLFASQAVEVGSLKSSVPGCGTYRLPLATGGPASYLDPLAYL